MTAHTIGDLDGRDMIEQAYSTEIAAGPSIDGKRKRLMIRVHNDVLDYHVYVVNGMYGRSFDTLAVAIKEYNKL